MRKIQYSVKLNTAKWKRSTFIFNLGLLTISKETSYRMVSQLVSSMVLTADSLASMESDTGMADTYKLSK